MVETLLAALDSGLSGKAVRGMANSAADGADTGQASLERTVSQAADYIIQALEASGKAVGRVVETASDKAFESAANVGPNIAAPAPPAFSWGGYIQALGILCLLLAALWFGVWLIRKYGRFNFLPRPGSLPRDALVMEAQMPIGPRKGLMVVRFLNRRLLLGVTDQRISLLTEEKAQNERPEQDFHAIMEAVRSAHTDSGNDSASGRFGSGRSGSDPAQHVPDAVGGSSGTDQGFGSA